MGVGGVGCGVGGVGGFHTSTAVILVLYILLVIILSAGIFWV
ncbi:YjcZ family sporulation protein [Paenibacillus filicis]|uniref:YjcZ family sporulation protein n=1 Tax=Paenibacillus filicis TaxID=669464 RepID=A0ABU9DIM0_9BACL